MFAKSLMLWRKYWFFIILYFSIGVVYAWSFGANTIVSRLEIDRAEQSFSDMRYVSSSRDGDIYTLCISGKMNNAQFPGDYSVHVSRTKLNNLLEDRHLMSVHQFTAKYSGISININDFNVGCQHRGTELDIVVMRSTQFEPTNVVRQLTGISHDDHEVSFFQVFNEKGVDSLHGVYFVENSQQLFIFLQFRGGNREINMTDYISLAGSIFFDALSYPIQLLYWIGYLRSH